jgi:hypothetical protein
MNQHEETQRPTPCKERSLLLSIPDHDLERVIGGATQGNLTPDNTAVIIGTGTVAGFDSYTPFTPQPSGS